MENKLCWLRKVHDLEECDRMLNKMEQRLEKEDDCLITALYEGKNEKLEEYLVARGYSESIKLYTEKAYEIASLPNSRIFSLKIKDDSGAERVSAEKMVRLGDDNLSPSPLVMFLYQYERMLQEGTFSSDFSCGYVKNGKVLAAALLGIYENNLFISDVYLCSTKYSSLLARLLQETLEKAVKEKETLNFFIVRVDNEENEKALERLLDGAVGFDFETYGSIRKSVKRNWVTPEYGIAGSLCKAVKAELAENGFEFDVVEAGGVLPFLRYKCPDTDREATVYFAIDSYEATILMMYDGVNTEKTVELSMTPAEICDEIILPFIKEK